MSTRSRVNGPDSGRRDFLRGSGAALGLSWLAANFPLVAQAAQAARAAQAAGAAFVNLSPGEGADLEAVAARIVPTDDTPGAREAGVVWFIDKALAGFMAEGAPALRAGLEDLNDRVREATGESSFAALEEPRQDEILRGLEETEFFGTVRFLTLAGLFALPSYGGNRRYVGWQMVGFEHRHVWVPPFGHYDAEAGEGGEGNG